MKLLFCSTKENDKVVDVLNTPPDKDSDPIMHHLWQGVKHELALQEIERGSVIQIGDIKKPTGPKWLFRRKWREWDQSLTMVKELIKIAQDRHVKQMYEGEHNDCNAIR